MVGPWEAWTATYADQLASLRNAWDTEVRTRLAALPARHPLEALIAPLALVHVERDTTDILREYRTRLNTLSRECTRVSTEIGVVGTLGSLALAPTTNALGVLFLLPVVVAGALYYGGHAAMNRMAGDRRHLICTDDVVTGDWAPGLSRPHSLRSLGARLLTDSVQILVGACTTARSRSGTISLGGGHARDDRVEASGDRGPVSGAGNSASRSVRLSCRKFVRPRLQRRRMCWLSLTPSQGSIISGHISV